MVNLLYMAIYGRAGVKETAYRVMTESRELSSYCQESVRPSHSRRYAEALQNLDVPKALELVVNAVIADNANRPWAARWLWTRTVRPGPAYLELMDVIESRLDARVGCGSAHLNGQGTGRTARCHVRPMRPFMTEALEAIADRFHPREGIKAIRSLGSATSTKRSS